MTEQLMFSPEAFENAAKRIRQGDAAAAELAALKMHIIVVPDAALPYVHQSNTPEEAAEFIRGVSSSGKVFVIEGRRWLVSKVPRRLVSPDNEKVITIDPEAKLEFDEDGAGQLAPSIFPSLPEMPKDAKSKSDKPAPSNDII